MNFEGYYQVLCKKGHYDTVDAYDVGDRLKRCPRCTSGIVWKNLVDQTNGDDEGYVELKIDDVVVHKCNTCDGKGELKETTYRNPREEEKTYSIVLNKYQRDNLLMLLAAVGCSGTAVPDIRVPIFSLADTGDWLREIGEKLGVDDPDPIDQANMSLEELKDIVRIAVRVVSGDDVVAADAGLNTDKLCQGLGCDPMQLSSEIMEFLMETSSLLPSVTDVEGGGSLIEVDRSSRELTLSLPDDGSRCYFYAKCGDLRMTGHVDRLDGLRHLIGWVESGDSLDFRGLTCSSS